MELPTDFSVEDSISSVVLFGLKIKWWSRLLCLLWEIAHLLIRYAPVLT